MPKKPNPTDFGLSDGEVARGLAGERDKEIQAWKYSSLVLLGVLLILMWEAPLFVNIICSTTLAFLLGLPAGQLLYQIRFPRHRKYFAALAEFQQWLIRTQKDYWESLNGRMFEVEVAILLKNAGYQPTWTGASGDKGVDIWLKDGSIIQCKAHRAPIGPAPIRELYGVLQHFSATNAIIVSRSGYSSGAREFAKGKPIILWDLSDLLRLQISLGK